MSLLEFLGFKKTPKGGDSPTTDKASDRIVFYCSYTSGGGMLGGHEEYFLVKRLSGAKKLTYSRIEMNGSEEVSGEMEPDDDLINRILYIYEKAGVKGYKNLEKSEYMIMDAPTTQISFRVDGVDTTIFDSDVLPKQGKGLRNSIQEVFYNYVFK